MNHTITQQQYGSDQAGLICGFCFHPDCSGEEIDSAHAQAWLRTPPDGDAFLWLHFNLANAASERWLRAALPLQEDFFEALRGGSTSTRIELLDLALLAVINDVAFSFGLASSDIATLWAHAQPRVLITARVKPLHSVDRLRAAVRGGAVFRSPAALLVHLLQNQADALAGIVRTSGAQVDVLEDRLLAQRLDDQRAQLAAMRRSLVRLQRLLAPEPSALFRLLNRPPAWLDAADAQALRQSSEEFALTLNDLSALVERIKLLQEELAARLNEQSNRTLFTLTLVTVLALPINIVAGFFGMNVGGVPLANHPHGFWVLVLLVASFSLLAGWWAFRRQRDV
ncbi:transporter [Chromobacterium haemolyticum]|uniref:Magnesium transporter CorA n=1 Tax=Chromobacterium haemolyticum TaxID=394935 RepID=A0A1W0D8H1_9NEIS|nr:transporter [Chromobacterium haemolyticum]OQS43243.1 magnesium transporter CorA [Chromobacterium haemolyticum]